MDVFQGVSQKETVVAAVEEATKDWYKKGDQYDFLLVFHSTKLDGQELVDHLQEKFPNTPIAGCSTSGEYLNGVHYNGALTLSAIQSPKTKWSVALLEDMKNVSRETSEKLVHDLLSEMGINKLELDPKRHFAITFMDGLSLKEESVVSEMVNALEGIPFLGGSAGDDLAFKSTSVIANNKSTGNAAVFVLVETDEQFEIIKHQHFKASDRDLVMTNVDEASRKVITIDGMPAAERYAQAIGKTAKDLAPEDFSLYPLTFQTNNQLYVRSIQTANEDGSLTFYCAIEEGLVLNIGTHHEMEKSLERDLAEVKKRFQKIDFFLMCNCILRSLEASANENHDGLGKHIKNLSPNVIGFDTYGEQLNGLHINQTLVGLVVGGAA